MGAALPAGDPDLRLGGLQLWIHGYESPDLADRDDGNWLLATAQCTSSNASTIVSGPFIRTIELARFGNECSNLHQAMTGRAALDPMESYLEIDVEVRAGGRTNIAVTLTPDLDEEHVFRFEGDQAELLAVSRACRAILRRSPERGSV